jgi:hypothetical protein
MSGKRKTFAYNFGKQACLSGFTMTRAIRPGQIRRANFVAVPIGRGQVGRGQVGRGQVGRGRS